MPISTLDPTTALIIIDLQKGVIRIPTAHPMETVVDNSVRLARAFRSRGLPVVLVNVNGRPPGRTEQGGGPTSFPDESIELISELDQQPSDILVTKRTRSAFPGTGLADTLRSLQVTQVVVTGVATASGVESTARDAHEQGFHVTIAVDAMTDRTLESHQHSIDKVFPRIAETGTTEDILRLLDCGSLVIMTEESDAVVVPTGFSHVRLTVTDIHRSKNFYRWLLGRDPGSDFSDRIDAPGVREDPSKTYGGCSFTFAGQTLGLRPDGTPGDRFDPNRVGLDHLSLMVETVAELHAASDRLDAAGVPHGVVTELPAFGLAILSVQDPDDINLEMAARIPRS